MARREKREENPEFMKPESSGMAGRHGKFLSSRILCNVNYIFFFLEFLIISSFEIFFST